MKGPSRNVAVLPATSRVIFKELCASEKLAFHPRMIILTLVFADFLGVFSQLQEPPATKRCNRVAGNFDHLLVNISVTDDADTWTLRPGTLYYFILGEPPLLSEATSGSCPGDERRFSTDTQSFFKELDGDCNRIVHCDRGHASHNHGSRL